VVVLLVTSGGPPESLAAAAPPRAGASPARWVFTASGSGAEPIAITTDPRGRAYVLAAYDPLHRADWVLLREGADGHLHTIEHQGSRSPGHDIEIANVAVGSDGTPVVAWAGHDGNLHADVGGHESLVARGFAQLGLSTDADPSLVATGDGGTTIAWTDE